MRPALRYIGGKYDYGKILDNLGLIPDEIHTYIEPFVGGGGFMCYIHETRNVKKYIINDKDRILINFYKKLKNNPNVYDDIIKNKHISKDKFFKCMNNINIFTNSVENAKCYLIVKTASFNSAIYKNIDGKYSGSYSTANAYFKNNIISSMRWLYDILQKSIIFNKDYHRILYKNAFIVIDPPYSVPDVQRYYANHDVSISDLFVYFKKLNNMNNKIVLFMNYSKEVIEVFKDYNIKILNKGARHLKGKRKNIIKELVITNY
jgi:DNA adenine methylase